ncbi:hypothetical protein KVR01_000379 [Diaporthe batatas]|uniref:uncharacterized protein n=1 Tax=Diaporthe batatas TaxID=748121 RepID=UPI001D05851A|nr:uncharacterized protein KVR01_000379 [Diaporthe batatas]KAG8169634.1 hypothetical protein KVR01_000379 [Diaporthe batatas]
MEGDSASDLQVNRFHPLAVDNGEDLERYEPRGFHPVHLDDYYDNHRYRVVHKLGAGGFSTVWLAQDVPDQRWVGLKFIVADESGNYHNRSSAIIADPILASSEFLVSPEREFWVDGPNGRHLCFVLPFVGPNLGTLSTGIYSRISPRFAANLSMQAAQAMALLHSRERCHGDFTANNLSLALSEEFVLHGIEDIYRTFGNPKSWPLCLADPDDPGPGLHAPRYFVEALDIFACSKNILAKQIRVLDFDQSFQCDSPPERTGTPAKYMAPEVTAGRPPSKASDVWSLGCTIFRLRAGKDIFFDYNTTTPAATLQQIQKFLGDLPESLARALFDDDGYPTEDETGEPLTYFLDKTDLRAEIKKIWDEPPSLSMRSDGEIDTKVYTDPYNPEHSIFSEEAERVTPYPSAYRSMFWKPTAVSVDGDHYIFYEDADSPFWGAFPLITDNEADLLGDLLSQIFVYDPSARPNIEEIVEHPWFKQYGVWSEEEIEF